MYTLAIAAFLLDTPEECRNSIGRAQLAYESRKFEAAAAEFEKAVSACGERVELQLALAQSHLMLQQFPGALEALDRALRLDPRNVAVHKLRGDVLYLTGKETEAESSLQQVLELDPVNEPALYALGRIYYQQSRYPEAIAHFQRILERDPKHYRAHDNVALCYEALNQDELALKHYFKALDLVHKDHPEYDWAYGNLANFFLRRNENEKAFQLAAEAAQRNPRSARNFFLTGKALFKLDKFDNAVRWLEESVRLDPEYSEPRYLLGQIYRKQGRNEDAERELAKFRELQKNPRARR